MDAGAGRSELFLSVLISVFAEEYLVCDKHEQSIIAEIFDDLNR